MDIQTATVPDLLQWFKTIREERSKLLAENDNERNADLLVDSTTAMGAVMKKIVSLTHGKSAPFAPAATPSNLFRVRLRHGFGNCFSFGPVL